MMTQSVLSNTLYTLMLTETWEEVDGMDGTEYTAVGKSGVYVLATDLALVWDPEFKAHSILYAQDNDYFLEQFGSAWTALMNADRFDGPTGNVCEEQTSANVFPHRGCPGNHNANHCCAIRIGSSFATEIDKAQLFPIL